MEKTSLHIQVDKETLEQATRIMKAIGLDMETAINIFLHGIVNKRGMPFRVSLQEDDTHFTLIHKVAYKTQAR